MPHNDRRETTPNTNPRVNYGLPLGGELLMKEGEVAARQGRSVRTLQNQRVMGGGIPFLKLGRSVRYRLSDVIAWEEARCVASTSGEGHRG